MSNEGKLWNYFLNVFGNEKAVAGLLGNIKAESDFLPDNLQNSFEKTLGSDVEYTRKVKSKEISRASFSHDGAGYGLCQWTFWSRKEGLYDYLKENGLPIDSLFGQAYFCIYELKSNNLLEPLKRCETIREASDLILTKYEMPADQSEAVKKLRCNYGEDIYKRNHKPVECNNVTISIQKIENELENLKKLLNLE